jgi:hypothetical protein
MIQVIIKEQIFINYKRTNKMKRKSTSGTNVNVVLVNHKFGERIYAGVMRHRDVNRMLKLWSILTAQQNEWFFVVEPTTAKVEVSKFQLILSDGIIMERFAVSTTTADAFYKAFDMHHIASKHISVPNYWNVHGRLATIHSLDRTEAAAKRMHYNIASHKNSQIIYKLI